MTIRASADWSCRGWGEQSIHHVLIATFILPRIHGFPTDSPPHDGGERSRSSSPRNRICHATKLPCTRKRYTHYELPHSSSLVDQMGHSLSVVVRGSIARQS